VFARFCANNKRGKYEIGWFPVIGIPIESTQLVLAEVDDQIQSAKTYASVKAKGKQKVPGAQCAPRVSASLLYPSPPDGEQ
jgi:hypothetical protein